MPRLKWTKEKVVAGLKKEKDLSWVYLRKHNPNLLSAAEKRFGSLRKSVEASGKHYDEVTRKKPLNKKWVIKEIHAFVASGDTISTLYTTHSNIKRKSKLLFGSVPKAFRAAGYRYNELKRNTWRESRWPSGEDVLRAIRKLPMTYEGTTHRNHRGLMSRAEKFFGSWGKAVEAAGLAYEYKPPPIWPAKRLLKKIQRLRDKSLSANMHTRLYHAARIAFGSWRYAVELAGSPYFEVAKSFRWTPEEVLYYIRWLTERGLPFNRKSQPELYKYTIRFFGSRGDAVRASRNGSAPTHFKHKLKRAREIRSNTEIASEIA